MRTGTPEYVINLAHLCNGISMAPDKWEEMLAHFSEVPEEELPTVYKDLIEQVCAPGGDLPDFIERLEALDSREAYSVAFVFKWSLNNRKILERRDGKR